MNKKGISLVGVKSIKEVEEIRERFPDAWFELSYMSTPESLKETLPLIKGRVASIHLLAQSDLISQILLLTTLISGLKQRY